MNPVIIHYPSGGFGHFMLSLCSICFDNVFMPSDQIVLDETGRSHSYPLHYKTWMYFSKEFVLEPNYNFDNKIPILLVDSGIDNDSVEPIKKRFTNSKIIRMCIDDASKSIITQTCKLKAENNTFNFDCKLDWEVRERFSLMYHYIDKNPNFCFNNFKPVIDGINISISDLFVNINSVVEKLSSVLGKYDQNKVETLHKIFINGNYRYYLANELIAVVKKHLDNNSNISLQSYTSLHDQGFLNYWIEKTFNINEIPPFDYKNWFKDVNEIQECIHRLTNVQN